MLPRLKKWDNEIRTRNSERRENRWMQKYYPPLSGLLHKSYGFFRHPREVDAEYYGGMNANIGSIVSMLRVHQALVTSDTAVYNSGKDLSFRATQFAKMILSEEDLAPVKWRWRVRDLEKAGWDYSKLTDTSTAILREQEQVAQVAIDFITTTAGGEEYQGIGANALFGGEDATNELKQMFYIALRYGYSIGDLARRETYIGEQNVPFQMTNETYDKTPYRVWGTVVDRELSRGGGDGIPSFSIDSNGSILDESGGVYIE